MNPDRSPQTKPNKATFIRRRIGAGAAALLAAAGVTAGAEALVNNGQDKDAARPNLTAPAPQKTMSETYFLESLSKDGAKVVQERDVYGKGTKIYTGPLDNTGKASGVEIAGGQYDVVSPIKVTDPATGIEYSVFKGEELTTADPASLTSADKFFWIADKQTPPLSSEFVDNGTVVTVNLDKQGDPTSTEAATVATGSFDTAHPPQINRLP